jgi:1,2-diacylglycerol 3-alpha-glucosyltransferase
MIFVGRMGGEKSIDKLIENFARVNGEIPNSHLLLVGDGPLRTQLKELSVALGVGRNLHFTGFLKWPTEISLAYKSSDLFIIASHTETFGLVTLEAMASGLPVVATRTTASPTWFSTAITVSCAPRKTISTKLS